MKNRNSYLVTLRRVFLLLGLVWLSSESSLSSQSIEEILKNVKSHDRSVQGRALLELDLHPDRERFRILSQISTAPDQDRVVRAFSLQHLSQILRSYSRGVDLGPTESFFGLSQESINQIEAAAEQNLVSPYPDIRKQAVKVRLGVARVKDQLRVTLEQLFRNPDPIVRGAALLDMNPFEWNRKSRTFSLELSRLRHQIMSDPSVQRVVLQDLISHFFSRNYNGLRSGWKYYIDFVAFPESLAESLFHTPHQGIQPWVRARQALATVIDLALGKNFISVLEQGEKEQQSAQMNAEMRAQMNAMIRAGELSILTQLKVYLAASKSPRAEIRLISALSLSPNLILHPDYPLEGHHQRLTLALSILDQLLGDSDLNVVRLASSKVAGILMLSGVPETKVISLFRKLLTHSDSSVRASGVLGTHLFLLESEEYERIERSLHSVYEAAIRDPNVKQKIVQQIEEALPLAAMAGLIPSEEISFLRESTLIDFMEGNIPPPAPPSVRPEVQVLFRAFQQAANQVDRPSIRLANLQTLQAGGIDFSDAIALIRRENETAEYEESDSGEEDEPLPERPETLALPPIPESKAGSLTHTVLIDQETRKLHLDAKKRLREKLDRRVISSRLFDLSKDYQNAEAVVDLAKRQPHPHSHYEVNYDYLAEDPYLAKHSSDIHQLYPNLIGDPEWNEMKSKLSHSPAVKQDLARQLEVALSPANTSSAESPRERETKQTIRKRIKRVMDYCEGHKNTPGKLGEHNTPLDDLAFFLSGSAEWDSQSQTYQPRCIDGLQDTVAEYEAILFSEGNPENAADFLSRVFTDYKMNFIRKYGDLNPGSSEFRTTAVQILRQRMLYSLGLRGAPADVAYPLLGNPQDPALQPWEVMSRFLAGGKAQLQHQPDGVEFEPYTVDKMIQLLNGARNRGLVDATGKKSLRCEGGVPLTSQALDKMTLHDSHLRSAYQNFFVDMDEPSPYFEKAPLNEYPSNIRLKDPFWLYLLEKHGYILRKGKGKKRQRAQSESPKKKAAPPLKR